MRRLVTVAACLASVATGVQPAAAAGPDRANFHYERSLDAGPDSGPVLVEPDGALFEHALPGFSDLRVIDAGGHEVPWRHAPFARSSTPEAVPALNSGRQGRFAIALFDLGARRQVRDRLELEIPEQSFVGRAVVLGSDDREGPFRRISATGIYDVRGAQQARSTVVVFPQSDFRYLLIKATGVNRITGAVASGATERPSLLRRTVRSASHRQEGALTIITLDLGFRSIPVDELRIAAETARYERPVTILGSNLHHGFVPLTRARIIRFRGSGSAPVPVRAHHRYIRIEIENGDDPPLRGVEVSAWNRSRALLIEDGSRSPYTVLYGNTQADSPSYDFARLPASALDRERSMSSELGVERVNQSFEPPPDTRSFAARNQELVTVALAFAALAVSAVGLLALRKRA